MVAKLCFYTSNEDWLFYAFKDAGYTTRVSCVIYFLCLLYYCFCLLFYEDLTVVRKYIYRIEIYCWWYFPRGFLYNFMTWRFSLLHFFSKVSISFLVLILAVVCFIASFSRIYCLGLASSFCSWVTWLHLVCVLLTILKKGKKHLTECFLFLRHAGVGVNRCWGGDLGIFCFSS